MIQVVTYLAIGIAVARAYTWSAKHIDHERRASVVPMEAGAIAILWPLAVVAGVVYGLGRLAMGRLR